ncbi:hypothetical protein FQN50_009883 [Emmonsiellopsis sp. PD_5]|nr:hypothetical protein FQN50_009883 [Emmonsiellopsis sp. PD_5]
MLTQKTELVASFIQSVQYRYFLLNEVDKGLAQILASFHAVTAMEALFNEKLPSLAELFQISNRQLHNLNVALEKVTHSLDMSENQCPPVKTGLLVALVANDERFLASLATTKPEEFLLNPFAKTEFTLTATVADGVVKMLFVCFHKQPEQTGRFLVGANGEFWGVLEEIGDICWRSRDLRLKVYSFRESGV